MANPLSDFIDVTQWLGRAKAEMLRAGKGEEEPTGAPEQEAPPPGVTQAVGDVALDALPPDVRGAVLDAATGGDPDAESTIAQLLARGSPTTRSGQVLLSRRQRAVPAGPLGEPVFTSPIERDPAFSDRLRPLPEEREFGTVEDVLLEIFRMPEEGLTNLQTRMFAAGFFPDSVEFEEIDFGNPDDPATQNAWERLVRSAEARLSAGDEFAMTPEEILNERINALGGLDKALEEEAAPEEPTIISLSNPQNLGMVMDRVGEQVLGRRPTADEKRMFVAMVHNLERSQTIEATRAQRLEGVTTEIQEAPAPQVAAEQFLRQRAPEDAAGMDVATAYRSFLSQLGAGGLGGGA